MIEEYKEYLEILDRSIPGEIYEGLLSMLAIGAVLILAIKGITNGYRMLAGWMLIEYLFLLLCSTLYFRPVNEVRTHHFKPFWSYEQCFKDGGFHLVPEIGLNILVFMPVGLLLGMSVRRFTWWKVLLTGACISVSIEVMQLIFKKGLSEFDDVFNNTLGCMAGYGIYCLADKTGRLIKAKTR